LKKNPRKIPFRATTSASLVDISGSGPVPIENRDPGEELSRVEPARPTVVRLKPNTPPAIFESLLRYVNEFGQGGGSIKTADGDCWLELACREDAEMLRSQFGDLLAETETCDGCCL
jgi:hypothetical protein